MSILICGNKNIHERYSLKILKKLLKKKNISQFSREPLEKISNVIKIFYIQYCNGKMNYFYVKPIWEYSYEILSLIKTHPI